MTEEAALLKSMIAHYKETGSRVDEVLFQEVMKVVEIAQGLDMEYIQTYRDEIKELKRRLDTCEKVSGTTGNIMVYNDQVKKIESAKAALAFYAADMTYQLREDKKGQLYTDIEKDRGRRARMYLRRESSAGGKNKDTK